MVKAAASRKAMCRPQIDKNAKKVAAALDFRRCKRLNERPFGQVAQLVEQGIENPRVGGSIPSLATTEFNDLAALEAALSFLVVLVLY